MNVFFGGSSVPLFLCRWPNGDCSFVAARNKTEAIVALDEVGNAESAQLFAVPNFMLHLALKDDGDLEFQAFGELTQASIEKAYPFLSEARQQEMEPTEQQIHDAVEQERTRILRHHQQASTDIARRVQEQMDAPAVLLDKMVEQIAGARLKDFKPKGKPQ